MEIYISNTSGVPIYAQITEQIRAKILSGELKEGEALPSIRLLAKELRISVITTKRAYEDLEQAGFIYTLPGKGSFVAEQNPEMHREEGPAPGGGAPAKCHRRRPAGRHPAGGSPGNTECTLGRGVTNHGEPD